MYQARKSPLFLNLTSNDAPLRNEAHSPHGYGGDQRAVTMRPISTPRTTQNCPSHAAEPSCLCLLETGTCSLKFREVITSKYVQSSSPPPFPSGAPPSQPLRPPSGPPGARVPPCGAGDGVSYWSQWPARVELLPSAVWGPRPAPLSSAPFQSRRKRSRAQMCNSSGPTPTNTSTKPKRARAAARDRRDNPCAKGQVTAKDRRVAWPASPTGSGPSKHDKNQRLTQTQHSGTRRGRRGRRDGRVPALLPRGVP